jgi:hypothetical protein
VLSSRRKTQGPPPQTPQHRSYRLLERASRRIEEHSHRDRDDQQYRDPAWINTRPERRRPEQDQPRKNSGYDKLRPVDIYAEASVPKPAPDNISGAICASVG